MAELIGLSDPRIADNWKAVYLNCMVFTQVPGPHVVATAGLTLNNAWLQDS